MTLQTKGPSCPHCEDWGCRRCRPAHEVAVAAGGEQGPSADELELFSLRCEVRFLREQLLASSILPPARGSP